MSEYTSFTVLENINNITNSLQQDINNVPDFRLQNISNLTNSLQQAINNAPDLMLQNRTSDNLLQNINNLTSLIQKDKLQNISKSISYLLENINSPSKMHEMSYFPDFPTIKNIPSKKIFKMGQIKSITEIPFSLVLLNFEDDTMRVATKLDEDYINIINNWYDKINVIVDIENLNIPVPHDIHKNDLNEILYNTFNVSSRNTIINDFVPQFMLKIKLEKNLQNINLFTQQVPLNTKPSTNNSINLEKLSIIIPTNINNITNNFNTIDTQYHNANFFEQIENTDFPFNKSPHCDRIKGSIILNHLKTTTETQYDNNNTVSPNRDLEYDKYESLEQINVIEVDNIVIVLNYMNLATFILVNPSNEETKIIKEHTEYGFIELLNIKTSNTHIVTFIKETFENFVFNNIDELNKTLDILSRYCELFNKSTQLNKIHNTEEAQIHEYLKYQYIINDDVNNKIKFTDLYNIILNTLTLSIDKTKVNGLKNRLSTYLKNLGLIKKRYSDGYYYYGIRLKNHEEAAFVIGEYLLEIKLRDEEEKKNFNLKDNFEKLLIERKFLNNNKNESFQTPIEKIKQVPNVETIVSVDDTLKKELSI